jgi:hypothetical protein
MAEVTDNTPIPGDDRPEGSERFHPAVEAVILAALDKIDPQRRRQDYANAIRVIDEAREWLERVRRARIESAIGWLVLHPTACHADDPLAEGGFCCFSEAEIDEITERVNALIKASAEGSELCQ